MMKCVRLVVLAGFLIAWMVVAVRVPNAAGEQKQVNINTASIAELGALQGIGDAKAGEIVAYREKNGPFKSVDDLDHVKGIGEKLLEKLRPQLTVSTAAAAAAQPAAKH